MANLFKSCITSVGSGCPNCGIEERSKAQTKTNQKFIEEAKLIHKGRYTYDKVEYITAKQVVIITCKEHGDFFKSRFHFMVKDV